MAKYNIPELLIAILEDKVKDVVGEGAVAAKLDDAHPNVRAAAIRALAPLTCLDAQVRRQLAPALQMDDAEEQRRGQAYVGPRERGTRATVVDAFGEWLKRDPAAWGEIIQMIGSEDWRSRRSGIEIVASAGEAAVRQVAPRLLAAMDDHRGLDSWPARIAAAELLLNDLHHSQQAIDTILPALEYGAHPLVVVPDAAEIRQQAALALGELKAEFQRPDVAAKLDALLAKERDPQVLDSLFNALQSLASAPDER